MLHPSTQKLIDRLAEMTAGKKIDWAEADETGGVIYATEGYAVILTQDPPHVSLTTEQGRLLEEANESLLKETPHEAEGNYAELVRQVTKEAARVAKGTEAAIDALLTGLEEQATNRRRTAKPDPKLETEAPQDERPAPVDASVPEAALIDEADAPQETISDFDEDDVGGAVARLADEVNGKPSDSASRSRSPLPAFSVTPEKAPHAQDVAQPEEIADASSGPIVSEDKETGPAEVWDEAGPDAGQGEPTPRKPFTAYSPFGLGGAQAVGSEASSSEDASEADIDSQLGAASTTMQVEADTQDSEGEPGEPPVSIPLDLRPLSSKFGYAAPGDWTPSKPSGYRFEAEADEAVIPPRTVIDATSEDAMPNLSGLDDTDDSDAGAASPDDVDAVAPPEETASSPAEDEDLFEDSPYSEDLEATEDTKDKAKEKPQPAKKRRKSRFNPWS